MTGAESDLPKGWNWATFREVATVAANLTDPADFPDHPHIAPNHIEGGTTRLLEHTTVAEDGVTSAKHLFFPGQILYSKIRPYLAKVTLVDFEGLCSADMYPVTTSLDSSYLLHWLVSPMFTAHASRSQGRSVLPKINHRDLASLPVPVPPLGEQRRIVAAVEEHLSRLDSAEALAITARHRLGHLERSILQKADDSRWHEMELGDLLLDIEAGKSFQTPGRRAAPDEWGVIKVSAMTWGAFDEQENKAVLDVDRVQARFEIQPGDLLFSRANTSELVGASVLVHRTRPKLLLSDKSMRLRPRGEVDPEWLRYCLGSASVRDQISEVASGTSNSMRNISQDKVRRLRVHLPPKGEQRRLAEEIASQREARARLGQAFGKAGRQAEALRRSILAAAFTGGLVAQDPTDEPADVLLARIAEERSSVGTNSRGTARLSTWVKEGSS